MNRDYMLAELRVLAARYRLTVAELDCIGMALKSDVISCDGAVEWLHDLGLDGQVGPRLMLPYAVAVDTGPTPQEDDGE